MNVISKAAALLAMLGLLSAMLLTACDIPLTAGSETPAPPEIVETPAPPPEPREYVIPDLPSMTAPGTAVEENDKALIDYSNMSDGYIMAKFHEGSDKQVRVLLTIPNGTEYTYRLTPGGDFEILPLSGGSGENIVRIFEQVEGTRYALALSATLDVVLTDEFAPFLRPNQFVNFNRNSEVVRKAAELTAGLTGFMDKIEAIYNFVITHIEYDIVLAETVQSGYLPDVDLVLHRGMGICFDYAAVMAAMLRSQGIPTKLVIGYAGEEYHAWISVWSEETGWVDDLIFFDGSSWMLMDPTFASSGHTAEVIAYIGDGTNYHERFFH